MTGREARWGRACGAAFATGGLFWVTAAAEDHFVADQEAYAAALRAARPGDRIVLADRDWTDFRIVFEANGAVDAPITLTAQTPGGARLTGESNLSIAGEHLIVSGLTFAEGYSPTDEVIAFRVDDDELASNVRLTDVVIENFNKPDRADQDSWVVLFGQDNVVERSAFLGKTNKGPTLIVRLDAEADAPAGHRIEANYFGPRPTLGGNGGETLRIGVSQTSDVTAGVTVRGNLFERCNGEVEIISLKAEGNTVTENLFYESRGSVVFRHGGNNEVSRNVFLGNGVPDTGGIRVINDSQTVIDNYAEGLRGRKFLGALVVMNGVPNSPQNRYHQVTDALIAGNSFLDIGYVGLGVGSDEERSAVPVQSTVEGNLITTSADDPLGVLDDMSGVTFSRNVADDPAFAALGMDIEREVALERAANGLLYPVGAAVDASLGAPRDLTVVARDAVGPRHYEKPPLGKPSGRVTEVSGDAAALARAVREAAPGDTIQLPGGDIELPEPLVIDRALTVRGAGTTLAATDGLFVIEAGGALTLEDLRLVQASDDAPVIRARGERYEGDYELVLRGVEAGGLTDEAAPLITADRETFARRIVLEDVAVRDWPGALIALSGEGLDGTYLAEEVRIEGGRFRDIGGPLITFGREGRDESTFGPRFVLTDAQIDRVGGDDDALRLQGIDGLTITGNRFERSGDVVVRRRVLGLPFEVSGNRARRTGALRMTGAEGEAMDANLGGGAR